MKIIKSNIIPLPGFAACNLFGVLFVTPKTYDRIQRGYNKTLINHESIHTAQMKELLYLPFYILYLLFWVIRIITPPFDTAYRDISFEQEAYDNQSNLKYLENRKHYNWLKLMFRSSKKNKK